MRESARTKSGAWAYQLELKLNKGFAHLRAGSEGRCDQAEQQGQQQHTGQTTHDFMLQREKGEWEEPISAVYPLKSERRHKAPFVMTQQQWLSAC